MKNTAFAGLLCIGLFATPSLALAQDAAAAREPVDQTTANQMTPDQIAAFNQAVTDFTAAQQMQQAGDNAGALVKYESVLPAIRTAVQVSPDNSDYGHFLANALYAAAAAQAGLKNYDAVIDLYKEAVPLWRKITLANKDDTNSRNVLTSMLIQLGNKALVGKDKGGAGAYYKEALDLARKSANVPADATGKNLLLSALIGLSQTSEDKSFRDEAIALGKAMIADGSIDAANKPSIEIMTGKVG